MYLSIFVYIFVYRYMLLRNANALLHHPMLKALSGLPRSICQVCLIYIYIYIYLYMYLSIFVYIFVYRYMLLRNANALLHHPMLKALSGLPRSICQVRHG